METVTLWTVGRMARALGVPLHRVRYALDKVPRIEPRALAGGVKVYDRAGMAALRSRLGQSAPGERCISKARGETRQ